MSIKKSVVKLITKLLIFLLVVVGVYIVYDDIFRLFGKGLKLFLPFIIAYIVSLLINPLVNRMEKHLKIPRPISAVIVILLTLGIIGGIVFAVGWKIVEELQSLYELMPDIVENVRKWWEEMYSSFLAMYSSLPEGVQDVGVELGDDVVKTAGEVLKNNSLPVFYGIGNFAIALPKIFIWIIVFILSLYFMISDSRKMKRYIGKCCTKRFLIRLRRVQRYVKKYVGGYVKAQLIIMSIAFIILLIGLSILDIEFALVIALGIALLDALPFFGSGAVLWPWAAISFMNGDIRCGIGMILIYLAVICTRQMIEPKIVSEHIGVYPVFTLMSMYVGYTVFSFGGMILGPILLILGVSFYKAGAFDGITSFIGKQIKGIKTDIKQILDYFNQ